MHNIDVPTLNNARVFLRKSLVSLRAGDHDAFHSRRLDELGVLFCEGLEAGRVATKKQIVAAAPFVGEYHRCDTNRIEYRDRVASYGKGIGIDMSVRHVEMRQAANEEHDVALGGRPGFRLEPFEPGDAFLLEAVGRHDPHPGVHLSGLGRLAVVAERMRLYAQVAYELGEPHVIWATLLTSAAGETVPELLPCFNLGMHILERFLYDKARTERGVAPCHRTRGRALAALHAKVGIGAGHYLLDIGNRGLWFLGLLQGVGAEALEYFCEVGDFGGERLTLVGIDPFDAQPVGSQPEQG